MQKLSNLDSNDLLYALLGAGIGGAGGYGLYKLLTPKTKQTLGLGLGSGALGALAGGGLGYLGSNEYQAIRAAMSEAAAAKAKEIGKKVQEAIDKVQSTP